MRKTLCAIIVAAFYFAGIAGQDSTISATKPAPQKTIKAGKFIFSYSIEGKNLNATVSAKTNGWISVGFNPKNVMQDANMIIGTIINGKPLVSDEFGDGMFSHKPDSAIGGAYSIISADVKQDSGMTTMTFCIPLDSGDPKDAKLVLGQKIKLIFATGASGDIRKKHKDVAKTTITL
jgi:hypothetical protein